MFYSTVCAVLLLLARPEFRPVMETVADAFADAGNSEAVVANKPSVSIAIAVAVNRAGHDTGATASAEAGGNIDPAEFRKALETIQQQNNMIAQQNRRIQKLQRQQIRRLQQQLTESRENSETDPEPSRKMKVRNRRRPDAAGDM